MLRIMIVDDEFLVRIGIQQTIDWEKHGFVFVGAAENGEDGLEMAKKLQPDIIITDIRMPNMDGLEFMSKLKGNGVAAKVIVLSGYDEFNYAREALNHGALAYLLKPLENKQLLDVVKNTGQKIMEERELKQYYSGLAQELPTVKKYQLIRMIEGASISMDAEDLKRINFPLYAKKIVIVLKVDEYDLFAISHQVKIESFHRSIARLSTKMYRNRHQIILERSNNEFIIIIQYDINDKIEYVYEYCQDIIQFLYNLNDLTCADLTFSVGFGNPFCNIAEISAAYQEAVQAAHFKLVPNANNVTHISDTYQLGVQTYIHQALAIIKQNYHKDITVEGVAGSLALSSSYLMHLFKNKLNKTFGECLSGFRINAAKELLRNPTCKIYEVSERVGYKDPKYFSQIFKKSTGLTPKDFAQLADRCNK